MQIQIQIQSEHSAPMHIFHVIYGLPSWLELAAIQNKIKIQIQVQIQTVHVIYGLPSWLELAAIQIFNGVALNLLYGKCVKGGDEEN